MTFYKKENEVVPTVSELKECALNIIPGSVQTYIDTKDWTVYKAAIEPVPDNSIDPYVMVWSAREYIRRVDHDGPAFTVLTRALWDIEMERVPWSAIRYKYAGIDDSGRILKD